MVISGWLVGLQEYVSFYHFLPENDPKTKWGTPRTRLGRSVVMDVIFWTVALQSWKTRSSHSKCCQCIEKKKQQVEKRDWNEVWGSSSICLYLWSIPNKSRTDVLCSRMNSHWQLLEPQSHHSMGGTWWNSLKWFLAEYCPHRRFCDDFFWGQQGDIPTCELEGLQSPEGSIPLEWF